MIASPAPSVMPRRLVAVVVTYNRLDKLKVTLARLLDSPAEELAQVVVVNNASTDGTADWLATQDNQRLDIRTSATNSGGAGGFESGMRHAMETHRPDWLVVMDDDGRPEPGALAAFHALPEGKWDAVAAAVYFPSGEICEMNRPSRNPFWHLPEFLRTLMGGGRSGFHIEPRHYQGDALQIDVTSFVGFFISADVVRRIGYPDPSLFIYGDDGIYTLGLSKSGERIGFEPGVRFEHDLTSFQGQGSVVQNGKLTPLWKIYYYHRNLLLLYRLAAGVLFWPAMLVILPKWRLKARHYGADQKIFLRLLRRAIWDGLLRRPGLSHAEVLRRSK
ncbi:glycosyltransferase family 2 protein [Epibacterium ulvae]|uniref:glycosyltransferase family 2 protein n=1 Tax=Epibacterium ulvae TaxID=1156985 RepID=UPI0024900E7C|nr:glycosyltransferase family 2 protein [Epibacterium ulvae]